MIPLAHQPLPRYERMARRRFHLRVALYLTWLAAGIALLWLGTSRGEEPVSIVLIMPDPRPWTPPAPDPAVARCERVWEALVMPKGWWRAQAAEERCLRLAGASGPGCGSPPLPPCQPAPKPSSKQPTPPRKVRS